MLPAGHFSRSRCRINTPIFTARLCENNAEPGIQGKQFEANFFTGNSLVCKPLRLCPMRPTTTDHVGNQPALDERPDVVVRHLCRFQASMPYCPMVRKAFLGELRPVKVCQISEQRRFMDSKCSATAIKSIALFGFTGSLVTERNDDIKFCSNL